ncbi:hypothetical protein HELRODRAFT_121032, partial [Helobdella robusta]|uniref:AAA+ ATPase domain-containing protein n=1 Tax=Helobdella robusta TaxID=6412 RepID=T1EGQ9_HELRO
PPQINSFLDQFIIGQDHPKKVLSVAVYNHYKRIRHNCMMLHSQQAATRRLRRKTNFFPNDVMQQQNHGQFLPQLIQQHQEQQLQLQQEEQLQQKLKAKQQPVLDKSNIILVGPTGCGKTFMVKTLAKMLDVPFAVSDCTALTQAGYVGEDVETVVYKLLQAADYDVEKAQKGIIFLDEIDKICSLKVIGHMRDVGGEGVQQGLLKLLEGTSINLPESKSSKSRETVTFDTTNVLFIASGAFDGMQTIIKNRKDYKQLGFDAKTIQPIHRHSRSSSGGGYNGDHSFDDDTQSRDWFLNQIESRDLVKFGMIPEFVGRFPVIVPFCHLDAHVLVRILTEPKDSLVSQYQHLLLMDSVKLTFTEEALRAVARVAIEKQIGARGLKSVMEQLLLIPMFNCPQSDIVEIIITEDVVLHGSLPQYVK